MDNILIFYKLLRDLSWILIHELPVIVNFLPYIVPCWVIGYKKCRGTGMNTRGAKKEISKGGGRGAVLDFFWGGRVCQGGCQTILGCQEGGAPPRATPLILRLWWTPPPPIRVFVWEKNREAKSNLKMKGGGKEIKLLPGYTPLNGKNDPWWTPPLKKKIWNFFFESCLESSETWKKHSKKKN